MVGTHLPGAGRGAIVYVHGLGGHRGGEKSEALAEACAAAGFDFFAFDFRGHGASTGSMRELTASRLLDEMHAIMKCVAERGLPRVGLVGSSMGGFAAAWYARREPSRVAGCVLLAPAFRFLTRRWENLTPEEREHWHRTGTRRLQNDWLDTELGYALVAEREQYTLDVLANGWQTPTLILHGVADTIVPARDSLDFLHAVTHPHIELRLYKDGDHRLTAYKSAIADAAIAFLGPLLNADRGTARPTS